MWRAVLMTAFLAVPLARTGAQGQSGDYTISADVNRVVLGVTVKDSHGGFVTGLRDSNFLIYDNGRPQAIKYFSADDVPVTLGLVIDNSGSMHMKRPQVNLAAIQFIEASNPRDEVFIVNFNEHVRMGLPADATFSHDRDQLKEALDQARPAGKTALYDAIDAALDRAAQGTRDKKVLLVISDGGDNASHATLDDVLAKARRSNAIIYTVGIYDDDDKDKNPGVLKKLAALTGGEMFRPERLVQIRETTQQVAREIRTQYTIGYAPEGEAADGSWHRLRVVASAPGHGKVKVRTREGYLAPSAATHASEKQTNSAAAGSADASGRNLQ